MRPSYGRIISDPEHPKDWIILAHQESPLTRFYNFLSVQRKQIGESIEQCLSKTPENASTLLGALNRYPFDLDEQTKKELAEFDQSYKDFFEVKEQFYHGSLKRDVPLVDGHKLMPHQVLALEIAIYARTFVLGDDLGLGKTLVGICLSLAKERQPALIVVEAGLATQWQKEFQKFAGIKPPILYGHKIIDRPSSPVYIVRYSTITAWHDWIRDLNPQTVIFDECQNLRNDKTPRYIGMKDIGNRAIFTLGLSGTLVFKGKEDVKNIYGVIDPGLTFPSNVPDEIHALIWDTNRYIRRTRDEIDKDLPPMKRYYKTVSRELSVVKDHMDLILALAKQAVDVSVDALKNVGLFDREMRQATGLAKVRAIASFVRMLVEQGRTVVLVAHHREVHRRLGEELADFLPLQYTGKQTTAQKDVIKEAFIQGESPILQFALRTGSGLDGLQAASYTMVFAELDWTPGQHEQAIGRLRRFGQKREVEAYFMVTDWGFDPIMMERLNIRSAESHVIAATKDESMPVAFDGSSAIRDMAKAILIKNNIVPPEKVSVKRVNDVLSMLVPLVDNANTQITFEGLKN
jgi:superfamily II DNA or RNA helicase